MTLRTAIIQNSKKSLRRRQKTVKRALGKRK